MAFVVHRSGPTFEIRESVATDHGPRARSLATFRSLSPAVLERAAERAVRPFDREQVRASARRCGAPVDASEPADEAVKALLRAIDRGSYPSPALERLLRHALGDDLGDRQPEHEEITAARWLAATPTERGEALRDLLLLVDAVPPTRRGPEIDFPPIRSLD